MNIIQAERHYDDATMQERFAAALLTDKDYDHVVRDDCIVLKPDGTPLLIYRKGVLPLEYCKAAFGNLKAASTQGQSSNRGMAGGKGKIEGGDIGETSGDTRIHIRKLDGSLSQTSLAMMSSMVGDRLRRWGGRLMLQQSDGSYVEREAKDVQSGIVGYMDGNPRIPYCRLTAFNINHPEMFGASLPLIRTVDKVFGNELPERYAAQRAVVEETSPDFYISGTVFTTLTVNLI